MSLEYAYDGGALSANIQPTSLSLTSVANKGDAAFGGFKTDDESASLIFVGHKSFTVEESDCAQPRLFTGWTTERNVSRSGERGLLVGDDRLYDVNIIDLNALFNFRQIRGGAANRPEESWGGRLAWIIGSDFLDGLIADTGYVMAAPPAWECDAADYRGQYPSAVFNDLLEVSNTHALNYFAFWDPIAGEVGLFLGPDDEDIGESTLWISNDINDVDYATIFPPSEDTTLARKPDQVYSEVTVNYRSGTKRLFRSRLSTALNYIRRGTNYDVPRVYSDNAAETVAQAFLDRHSYEIDQITTTIIVPAASAGLVRAGQRINVKFTHLPGYEAGYDEWTSMRVAECTPTPADDIADFYAIRLLLELPQEAGGQPPPSCDWTPSGTYNYLCGAISDGVIYYFRPGMDAPVEPDPGWEGNWNFPKWCSHQCEGDVDADYAGDCSQNVVRAIVGGPGVAKFNFAGYCGALRAKIGGVFFAPTAGIQMNAAEERHGDNEYGDSSITFTVPNDEHCYHILDVMDTGEACGSKWGFLSMEWTSGDADTSEDQGFPPGSTLGETPDVNAPAPNDGDVLTWDEYANEWVAAPGGGSLALDDLTDVDAPAPNDGDVLTWDEYANEWVAAPGGGGGGLEDQGAFTYLDATDAAAPAAPAAGYARIYSKSGRIYSRDSAGTEYGPFDAAGAGLPIDPATDMLSAVAGVLSSLWTLASGMEGVAGTIYYIPIIVPQAMTIYRFWYVTGTNVIGDANVDLGIYDTAGNLIKSTGVTAWNKGNASTFTTIDVADTALPAGLHYLAFMVSATTNVSFTRAALSTAHHGKIGGLTEAGAASLPASATWAFPTTGGYIPLFGVLGRSEVT